jgi:hypothetical protein
MDLGCTPSDAAAVAGLRVTVTNASDGTPICDATVTADEVEYTETLAAASCTWSGAFERPGNYVVTATRAGFKDGHAVVTVVRGSDCHVVPVNVSIALMRDALDAATADLGVATDALEPDLAESADLAAPSPDLTVPSPDLAMPSPDLVVLPDLTVTPDLAQPASDGGFAQSGDPCGQSAGGISCAPTLVCCYPCGIPGCQYRCQSPCVAGPGCFNGCPLLP